MLAKTVTSFANLEVSLEFNIRWVYKDFISKVTKLLEQLPEPKRKQIIISYNFKTTLVSLTCLFISANT